MEEGATSGYWYTGTLRANSQVDLERERVGRPWQLENVRVMSEESGSTQHFHSHKWFGQSDCGGMDGRGLHSSTSQLNLSRSCHENTSLTPPVTPLIPPDNPYTICKHSPYPTESAHVELKSVRV
jgi:hypothetical protein